MTRSIFCVISLLIVTGCGIKRPLIPPKDIPAYEENMQKKRERLMQEEENAITLGAPTTDTH